MRGQNDRSERASERTSGLADRRLGGESSTRFCYGAPARASRRQRGNAHAAHTTGTHHPFKWWPREESYPNLDGEVRWVASRHVASRSALRIGSYAHSWHGWYGTLVNTREPMYDSDYTRKAREGWMHDVNRPLPSRYVGRTNISLSQTHDEMIFLSHSFFFLFFLLPLSLRASPVFPSYLGATADRDGGWSPRPSGSTVQAWQAKRASIGREADNNGAGYSFAQLCSVKHSRRIEIRALRQFFYLSLSLSLSLTHTYEVSLAPSVTLSLFRLSLSLSLSLSAGNIAIVAAVELVLCAGLLRDDATVRTSTAHGRGRARSRTALGSNVTFIISCYLPLGWAVWRGGTRASARAALIFAEVNSHGVISARGTAPRVNTRTVTLVFLVCQEWHKESGQRTRLLRSRSAHTLTPL